LDDGTPVYTTTSGQIDMTTPNCTLVLDDNNDGTSARNIAPNWYWGDFLISLAAQKSESLDCYGKIHRVSGKFCLTNR